MKQTPGKLSPSKRKPHAVVERRHVFVAPGKGTSRTINICSNQNQWGKYETTVRIPNDGTSFEDVVEKLKVACTTRSVIELKKVLQGSEWNGRVEDFATWSAEWKKLRETQDVEKAIEMWRAKKASDWERTDWTGEIESYRHKIKSDRGEKKIERLLFERKEGFEIRVGEHVIGAFKATYHQKPLANQKSGQVIADASGVLKLRKGKKVHPLMVEVKDTANDCWYALIECLQQVQMARAYPDFKKTCPGTDGEGVWGMVLAPEDYFTTKRSDSLMSLCNALLKRLKQSHARIAFASSDKLKDGIIELLPEHHNWAK